MGYTSRGPGRKSWKIVVACAAVVLDCAVLSAFEEQAGTEAAGRSRVRSTSAEVLKLVREGCERSTVFSQVVAEIEKSNGIVYVEFGYCAFGHLNGCLLPFITRVQGDRYLRVVVTPDKNQRTHDQLLALMAHELQHALEVIGHDEVVDAPTMQEMFRRIGAPVNHGYETPAAQARGDKVLAELVGRGKV